MATVNLSIRLENKNCFPDPLVKLFRFLVLQETWSISPGDQDPVVVIFHIIFTTHDTANK